MRLVWALLGAVCAAGADVTVGISLNGADRAVVSMVLSAGRSYQLESTSDFVEWRGEGLVFVASGGQEPREMPLTDERRFFRVREIQTAGGAPDALRTITLTNERNATGPVTYTVALTGAREGTFEITAGALGMGTFTYAPSGNSARFVMTYQDFPGDKDDLELDFAARTYSGTQLTSGASYPVSGTFAFQAQ